VWVSKTPSHPQNHRLCRPPIPVVKSTNHRLRDECLNLEVFTSLAEARVVIGDYREHYNHRRPHSSLDYRPPAAFAAACRAARGKTYTVRTVTLSLELVHEAHLNALAGVAFLTLGCASICQSRLEAPSCQALSWTTEKVCRQEVENVLYGNPA